MDNVEYLGLTVTQLDKAISALKAENAKLRKLLQLDYSFMVHLNECEAYPSTTDIDSQRGLMRKLGIEVES